MWPPDEYIVELSGRPRWAAPCANRTKKLSISPLDRPKACANRTRLGHASRSSARVFHYDPIDPAKAIDDEMIGPLDPDEFQQRFADEPQPLVLGLPRRVPEGFRW